MDTLTSPLIIPNDGPVPDQSPHKRSLSELISRANQPILVVAVATPILHHHTIVESTIKYVCTLRVYVLDCEWWAGVGIVH